MTIRPVKVRRIDWFRVLCDLKGAGMSLGMVASLTGVSKSVLIGLRNKDADTKSHAAEAIVTLWIEATKQEWVNLPRWGDEYKPRKTEIERHFEAGATAWCPLCGAEHQVKGPKRGPVEPASACSDAQLSLIS